MDDSKEEADNEITIAKEDLAQKHIEVEEDNISEIVTNETVDNKKAKSKRKTSAKSIKDTKQTDTEVSKKESGLNKNFYTILWIFILGTFLAILMIVKEQEVKEEENYTETTTATIETCPQSEITLGDGLCNDETNIEVCRYDGGDCCLEEKPKIVCTECQCKLGDNDVPALIQLLSKLSQLSDDESISQLEVEKLYSIENVENQLTCMVQCKNIAGSNSWLFQSENNDCSCTKVDVKELCKKQPNENNVGQSGSILFFDMIALCGSEGNTDPETTTQPLNNFDVPELGNMTKILIATGSSDGLDLDLPVEFIDITDSDNGCSKNVEFPMPTHAGVGGLIFDTTKGEFVPIACGGSVLNKGSETSAKETFKDCLNILNGQPVNNDMDHHVYSSSIVIDNQLYITGGQSKFGSETQKSVLFTLNQDSKSANGPANPIGNAGHCLVNIKGQQKIMLLGGSRTPVESWTVSTTKNGEDGDSSFMSNQWTQGPYMSKARVYSSCGLISDMEKPEIEYVVVAGTSMMSGGHYPDEARTTELTKLGTGYFRGGPILPAIVYNAASVTTKHSLLLIGGQSDKYTHSSKIHELTCTNEACKWSFLKQELSVARSSFVAMLIPDDLYDCN